MAAVRTVVSIQPNKQPCIRSKHQKKNAILHPGFLLGSRVLRLAIYLYRRIENEITHLIKLTQSVRAKCSFKYLYLQVVLVLKTCITERLNVAFFNVAPSFYPKIFC